MPMDARLDRTKKELSNAGYDAVEKTIAGFCRDEIPGLGVDFNVWSFSRAEQLGLFLGMFVKEGLVREEPALNNLFSFANELYSNYKEVPYHSFNHAMDVTYMVYYMLTDMAVYDQCGLQQVDMAALLLAAIGHDVMHPGNNNMFQVNTKSPAARQYNNESVLENVSKDFVRGLLAKYQVIEGLFLKNQPLPKEQLVLQMTRTIDELILKTDMIHHFRLLECIVQIAESREIIESATTATKGLSPLIESLRLQHSTSSFSFGSINELGIVELKTPKMRQDVLNCILHTADISNPARPFKVCKKWSDLILTEFREQFNIEKQLSLPSSVSLLLDNQPKSQLEFLDIIVRPFFDAMYDLFPRFLNLIDIIAANSREWEQMLPGVDEELPRLGSSNSQKRRATADQTIQPSTQELNLKPVSNSYSGPLTNGRRISIAPGVIEIPASVEKYLSSVNLKQTRASISGTPRRVSLARSMAKAARNALGKFGSSESEVKEEEEEQ
ncbi:hypothetical protein EDD86DRAFT_227810 [Gorgonomyces haynaldii]|nr:hypothetical protein EDD86DRAFT_227810 [Gorgonomyces haynaldii]